VQATVVNHLACCHEQPGFEVDRSFASLPVRNIPDLTVFRDGELLHLFQVVRPGPIPMDLVHRSWRPMADWAEALGATFWVLVPTPQRPYVESLIRNAGIDLRLAGYRLGADGDVRIDW